MSLVVADELEWWWLVEVPVPEVYWLVAEVLLMAPPTERGSPAKPS